MHVHEVVFEVVKRQPIFVNEDTQEVQVVPESVPAPPEPWETDSRTRSSPTRARSPGSVRSSTPRAEFVWHCHIVEHEDNEMMRPYRIGPAQLGQPG
jgi:spore coat protein A, manganese oxidase